VKLGGTTEAYFFVPSERICFFCWQDMKMNGNAKKNPNLLEREFRWRAGGFIKRKIAAPRRSVHGA
jgi:hypothetical protein